MESVNRIVGSQPFLIFGILLLDLDKAIIVGLEVAGQRTADQLGTGYAQGLGDGVHLLKLFELSG